MTEVQLNVTQAAAFCGVDVKTLWRYRKAGLLRDGKSWTRAELLALGDRVSPSGSASPVESGKSPGESGALAGVLGVAGVGVESNPSPAGSPGPRANECEPGGSGAAAMSFRKGEVVVTIYDKATEAADAADAERGVATRRWGFFEAPDTDDSGDADAAREPDSSGDVAPESGDTADTDDSRDDSGEDAERESATRRWGFFWP